MAELKVGGEVDAFCTKCKMVLGHTVLAVWAEQIKRVRCNTCMGEHAFKAAAGTTSKSSSASPKPRKAAAAKPKGVEKAQVSSYEAAMAGKDTSTARKYNPKEKFEVGAVIAHPAFGLGVVAAARGLEKIDIAFPGGVKTLLHNRGAAPQQVVRAVPHRPSAEAEAAEEKAQPDAAADTSDGPEPLPENA